MKFLSISGIHKQYGPHNRALINFSLGIKKGSVWSLVGESGSGKSTLLRIIAGLEVPDKGSVTLHGEKILSPVDKLVAGYDDIQLIHQQNNLYPNSTVEENLARPLLLYDKDYKAQRVEALLDLLHLQPHRHKFPRQLSGGQQQKVAIGRALSIEPEVLLLDEPFSSLDNIQKRILLEELKELFEQLKVTVILVTHDIDDAMTLTDQLCILKKGRVAQKGKAWEILENPKNLYVAQLLSELNSLPDFSNAYVRPSDINFEDASARFRGKVIAKQYLIPFNQLKVQLQGCDIIWKLEDRDRKYQKGDLINLGYDEEKILKF